MRNTKRYPVEGTNSLWQIYKTDSFFKVMKNFIIISIGRFMPLLSVKNWLYRTFLKMNVGKETAFAFMVMQDTMFPAKVSQVDNRMKGYNETTFALMVMPDTMFPEKISIGDNTIIGYNTTILAHEYLINEYRIGEVKIGNNVLIGANTTILPGVEIGDNAIISAASLVHKNVEKNTFVGGNPMKLIYSDKDLTQ